MHRLHLRARVNRDKRDHGIWPWRQEERRVTSMNVPIKPIYVDLATTASAVSLSVSTVEKLVRESSFPAPRVLSGRRVAFLLREVELWCEQRPVSDLPPPPCTGKRKKATPDCAPASRGESRVG